MKRISDPNFERRDTRHYDAGPDYDGRSIKNGQHLTPIENDRRWTGETKLRGALVHCGRIIYFVERFGRVTRFMQGYHASAKL